MLYVWANGKRLSAYRVVLNSSSTFILYHFQRGEKAMIFNHPFSLDASTHDTLNSQPKYYFPYIDKSHSSLNFLIFKQINLDSIIVPSRDYKYNYFQILLHYIFSTKNNNQRKCSSSLVYWLLWFWSYFRPVGPISI